jgi:hypothetical protein
MPRALPLLLLLVLALCACNGPTATREAAREAELKDLRERVDRLEQERAEERAKLGQDVDALRSSLDEANQRMAALDGKSAESTQPGKSPRAALKQSLSEVLNSARQALERLNKSLEQSLSRSKVQEPPAK